MLFAAVAVFGLSNVNAQEEAASSGFAQGDIYATGSLGFNSTKYGDSKTNDFTFSPAVGYFVSDNIALELNVLVGSGKDSDDNKTSTFGGGLGATYFFTPASQFSFTLGLGASYATQKLKYDDNRSDRKWNGFGVALVPGLNYFVSDSIALRAGIGALSYTSVKADISGADADNSFGLNLDLTDINFGVTYKF